MFPPVRTAGTETFGLPAVDSRLIAKLRTMDPALLASILTVEEASK